MFSRRDMALALGLIAITRKNPPRGGFNKAPKQQNIKVKSLVAQLKKYNKAYRSGEALISDFEYDELIEKLRAIDPTNEWLLSVEPQPIPKGRRRVFHNPPMLSTKKAYKSEKVRAYLESVVKAGNEVGIEYPTVVITPKLDGIAVDWSDNRLSTKGDGEYGGDITNLIDEGLVFVPSSAQNTEFRGEMVISRSYFNQMGLGSKYSQPRSFITALNNSKNLSEDKIQALSDGAVHLVSFNGFGADESKTFVLIPENIDLIVATIEEIHADLINSVDYDCDGIVLTCVDLPVQYRMGINGNHWAFMLAYKMRGDRKVTTVTSISWSMSRYGILTPVINFDPVFFDTVTYADGTVSKGLEMKRASGFNFSLCQRRGYGVGAEIVVLLSGEVIPYISEVVNPSYELDHPKSCPYCDTPTVIKGPSLMCPNQMCRGALARRIELFTSELNMAGFGKVKPNRKGAILKLVDKGFNTVSKILNMRLKDFSSVVGPKTAKKLYRSVQKAFVKPLPKEVLIRALGIAKIGEEKSKDLVYSIPDLDIRSLNEIRRQELMAIKGIGGKTADSMRQSIKQMWPQLKSIVSHDFQLIEPQRDTELRPDAKRFMFSGWMSMGEKQIQRQTRESGHIVSTRFTDGVDYLVLGQSPGSYRKSIAKQKGIKMISEQEFLEMINGQ